jgi:hypothetical protein
MRARDAIKVQVRHGERHLGQIRRAASERSGD